MGSIAFLVLTSGCFHICLRTGILLTAPSSYSVLSSVFSVAIAVAISAVVASAAAIVGVGVVMPLFG